MAKAKWMATAMALLGLACGAASAETKIGYLPSTVGQAAHAGLEDGHREHAQAQQNVSFQALGAQMKAEIRVR